MLLDHSKIIKLITNNYHERALNEIKVFAAKMAPKYVNEISSHQTNLNALKRDNRVGLMSRDEYNRDMSKLTMAILELLDNLKPLNSITEAEDAQKLKLPEETLKEIELYEKIIKLYPKGIQDNRIWERSGGDISYFQQNSSPKEQWWDAIKRLANGGGGNITLEKLLFEIRNDFPNLK